MAATAFVCGGAGGISMVRGRAEINQGSGA